METGNTQLRHELLVIPASGQLVDGLFVNALDVDGSRQEGARVTFVRPNIPVQNSFLGKLFVCLLQILLLIII